MATDIARALEEAFHLPLRGSRERTFLVVDASATIRIGVSAMLAKMGHTGRAVDLCATPQEARDRFETLRPSVVLLDLDDDEEEGLATALEMLERDPHVRLVILTAEGRASPRVRRAIRAGAFDVIEKPLRHEKIRAVLGALDSEEGGVERLR